MTTRILAASLLGLLATVGTLAPVETSARTGALLAARPMGTRVAPRIPIVRPVVRRPAALPTSAPARPLVRAPHVPLVKDPKLHAFHAPPRRHRIFGFGLPITVLGGSAFYCTTYDPADDVAPYDVPYVQPAYPNPTIVGNPAAPDASPLAGEPRQCRTQVQTVPKGNGGRQTITIVRC